jgi:transposase
MLGWAISQLLGLNGKIRFFCGDEARIGLKTISGKKITATGIKPVGKVQWQFKATYIYGIVEPMTGEHFFYEFTHLNSACFQVFLELVARQYPEDILIIQLDNGAFHKAKKLVVPHNIVLMFQPAYCPELNPIERVWQHLKRGLRWQLPNNLTELRQLMTERLLKMTQEVIASIVGWDYILEALSVAGL